MTDQARKFSAKERKSAASTGAAMSDGSFPVKNAADLKNAIKAVGRAKNSSAAKAHIIKRAKALGLSKMLPNDWAMGVGKDFAAGDLDWDCCWISCPECADRRFLGEDRLAEHAETVHTFDDITRVVSEAVREAYGDPNPDSRVWTWVESCAMDYVVFSIEKTNDMNLYKADYTLDGTTVTLGDPVQVVRRTVYDPVQNPDPAPVKNAAAVADGQ